ncbi:flagellin, partial [Mobiluncus mulieris]|uniref:flagellin n=1 Tax=Mobiluncus mulieris TaxID=2052 RepID=UPI0021E36D6E
MTNFNGTQLLDGSASAEKALKFQVGANGDSNNRITVDLKDADVTAISKFSQASEVSKVFSAQTEAITDGDKFTFNIEGKSFSFTATKSGAALTDDDVVNGLRAALAGKDIGFVAGGKPEAGEDKSAAIVTAINASAEAGKDNSGGMYTLTIGGHAYTYDGKKGGDANAVVQGLNQALEGSGYKLVGDKGEKDVITKFKLVATDDITKNKQVEFKLDYANANGANVKKAAETFKGYIGEAHGDGFEFTVKNQQITFRRADGKNMDIDKAHSVTKLAKANAGKEGLNDEHVKLAVADEVGNALGDYGTYYERETVDSLTVKDHDSAQNLINVLDAKINSVSTARSNLGAIQNRFEHTITNLNVAVENLAA